MNFIGGVANVLLENNQTIKALPLGIFRHKNNLKPITGDIVEIELKQDQYIIVNIYSRLNLINRPTVSNVDKVVIIQSVVQPDLNTTLLNKFLMFYEYYVSDVSIAFSKSDLLDQEQYTKFLQIKNMYQDLGYSVYDLNNQSEFKMLINSFENKFVCLVGNSGVGKSTFLNKINPNLLLRVQQISHALNRGKHTTTSSSIIRFDKYFIIDTPGFSSLDLNFKPNEINNIWKEFKTNSNKCKFNNCLHLNEPNCEIKNLVKSGKILHIRYDDYKCFINSLNTKKIK